MMALKRKLITFSIEYKGTKNSLEMLTIKVPHTRAWARED